MSQTCFCEVISCLVYQRKDVRAMLHDSRVDVARLRAAHGATQLMAEAGSTLVLDATNEYLEGYEEALVHMRTLFPSLDLQPCKPHMWVEGGHLVDLTKGGQAEASREIPKVGRAREGATDVV